MRSSRFAAPGKPGGFNYDRQEVCDKGPVLSCVQPRRKIKMSDAEILEEFEDWLIDEIDSLSDLPKCRGYYHEAKAILRIFRKIKKDGRNEN